VSEDPFTIPEQVMNTIIHQHTIRGFIQGCFAVSLCCIGFSALAIADGKPETASIVVRFGDLNLSNPEGVAKLDQRIRHAGTRVCTSSTASFSHPTTSQKCIDEAVDAAVRKINYSVLTAMHEERSSRRVG
jgi:UrcA family protein